MASQTGYGNDNNNILDIDAVPFTFVTHITNGVFLNLISDFLKCYSSAHPSQDYHQTNKAESGLQPLLFRQGETGSHLVLSFARSYRLPTRFDVMESRKAVVDAPKSDSPASTANLEWSIASPANSNSRPQSSKEDCPVPNWTSFLVGSDQGLTNCNEATESLNAIDMANNRSFSAASDLSFFNNNGLPTPGLSPPQFARYLSPAQFEIRPSSRGMTDTSKLFPPSQVAAAPAPFIRNVCQSPVPPDDQETVCIKLLAHLKRHAGDVMQPRESQLVLLKKTNAAVRRILHSKTIRSAYTCHLLLSSILNQLVDLCELLCQQPASKASRPTTSTVDSQFLQDQVHFETFPGFFAGAGMPLTPPLDYKVVMAQVKDVMSFASTMGDMLKRKPLGGFQSLGRHETFHAELEQRLERAAGMVQLCHGSDWRTSNHV
ncbi:hypothetical protein LTR10_016444 [Elasticomyces elasticus]|nr:hypothetical protein LTR10_016444 [Elasticomyces elasticus]